jgi:GIY-YIG catalytic domain
MVFYVFDLFKLSLEQVREVITYHNVCDSKRITKSGLKGGIYLWINKSNGKTYVGSSINLGCDSLW